jgi:hypothetical protein
MRELRVAFPIATSYLSSVVSGAVKPDALRIRAAQVLIVENRAFVELVKDRLLAPVELDESVPLDTLTPEELAAEASTGWEG